MDKVRLLKVLSRFKKDELPQVLERVGLKEEHLKKTRTKRELLSILVDRCVEDGVSERQLLQLELEHVMSHPNSTRWKTYRLENNEVTTDVSVFDFCKRFQLYIGDIFNYDISQITISSGHWMCLRIQDEGQSPYTCFIFRSPPTPFLFLSGVRKPHLAPVLEAVSLALECSGCTDLDLSGRNLDSLVELAIHQHSQGPYSAYRLNKVDLNPLLSVAKRRCQCDVSHGRLEGTDRNGLLSEEDKRKKAAKDAFGDNPLPVLEKFTFKLMGNLQNITEPIQCKVKFSGSNVLEGIKECVTMGSVTLPVPQTLTCMPRLASNSVTLETTTGSLDQNNSPNTNPGE